jgi:hypothetical protein
LEQRGLQQSAGNAAAIPADFISTIAYKQTGRHSCSLRAGAVQAISTSERPASIFFEGTDNGDDLPGVPEDIARKRDPL